MVETVRIAAVHLGGLPIECAFSSVSEGMELGSRLAAVRADVRGRAILIDVSSEARRRGLVPGMTMTEARAAVPQLEVRARDPESELTCLRIAAELLFQLGPIVEVAPPAFLFVEVGRSGPALEKILGGAATDLAIAERIVRVMGAVGHDATVAIAKDPDTARTFAERRTLERRAALAPVLPSGGRGRKTVPKAAKGAAPKADPKGEGASAKLPSRGRPEIAPVVVIPRGEEVDALSRLPIEALTWTDALEDPDGQKRERLRAMLASLRVLGIQGVSGLRMLPADQVATRFGAAGALMMQRASAELERPLRPFQPPERLVEAHEIDGTIEDLEPVLFMLKRIFARLESRLEARALAASSLLCTFEVVPSLDRAIETDAARRASSTEKVELELVLARPSRRASTMLALAREKLGGALPGAIRAIRVEARQPSVDRGAQLDLFSGYAKKLEDVSELVGRLIAAFGAGSVFSPEVADTHRPEAAWVARPFEIERALETYRMDRPTPKPVPSQPAPVLARDVPRSAYALPSVSGDLAVAVMPSHTVESVLEALAQRKKSWPKPIQRKPEDEPLAALPPRPLELLETPERATLLLAKTGRESMPEGDAGVLLWRGQRLRLMSLGGWERLEGEWWTETPLRREYAVAEVVDGRKLWIFFEPSGDAFVHGVFD